MATKKVPPKSLFDAPVYDPHMDAMYNSQEMSVAKYKEILNAKHKSMEEDLRQQQMAIADMYGALPLSHKTPGPPPPASPYHTGTVTGAGSILGPGSLGVAPRPPSPFWKDVAWEKTLGDDNAFIKMFRESSLNPELKARFDKFAKDWIKAATGMQKRIKDLESENQTLSNQAAEEKNVWAKYPFKTLTAAKIEESVRENNSLLDRMAAKLEKLK